MLNKSSFLFILFLISFFSSNCQEKKIQGYISDSYTKKPISNVVVTLALDSLETEIKKFSRTSENGFFSIDYDFIEKKKYGLLLDIYHTKPQKRKYQMTMVSSI